MKKYLKLLLFIPMILIIIGVFTISSCHKEELSNKNAQLLATAAQNSDVQNMLSELNPYNLKVNTYGLFEFQDAQDVDDVLDILQKYTFLFNEHCDTVINYPDDFILSAFEEAYKFNSLRAQIDREIKQLENAGTLTDKNDPDDHYIISPYQRAILSPTCQMVVSKLICTYFDNYGIGIMNSDYTTVQELNDIITHSNYSEIDMLTFCSCHTNAFILSDAKNVVADFSFSRSENAPNTIYFTNLSYSENYTNISYYWDFGDGYHSTEKNPIHTYNGSLSAYAVTLTASTPIEGSSSITKVVSVIGCQANFTYVTGTNGKCTFTSTSITNGGSITSYEWFIDDGSGTHTTTTSTYTHTFNHNAVFNVRLTIHTNNNCNHAYNRTVTISNAGLCCLPNDREVEKNNLLANNRRIKSIIRVTNIWPFHRICSRVIHQKKNKANCWVRERVAQLTTGYNGTIYNLYNNDNNVCGTPTSASDYKTKNNNSGVTIDNGNNGVAFRISRESIGTYFKYKRNNNDALATGIGPKIHQEPCSN
jgi:hypothetical protein